MILKRIAEGVRNQDWFVVGVEIMIVVVGIFIGLQVDDWNEGRKEKSLEHEYLVRLHADMVGTLEDAEIDFAWDRTRINMQNIVLSSLRSSTLPKERVENFNRGLFWLGLINPMRIRWSTVDELLSTGNLSIIQDLELRTLIVQTKADYDLSNYIMQFSDNQIIAIKTVMSSKYDVISFGFEADGVADLRYDFEVLSKDQDFINSVSQVAATSVLKFHQHQEYLNKVTKLRDKLASLVNE